MDDADRKELFGGITMITLEIEPYCEKCNKFVAETEHIYAGGDYIGTIVYCGHKQICYTVAEQLKARLKEEK